MAEIRPFSTETAEEKRLHRVKIKNGKPIPSIEYINKDYNVPKELIKYYNADEYGYKALNEGKIWATHPFSFNDPFDCTIPMWNLKTFPIEFASNHLRELGLKIDTLPAPWIRKLYFEIWLQFLGIFCLNDNSSSDLFWGYYNDHKGFSVVFDSDTLNTNWGMKPLKVEYENEKRFEKINLQPEEIINKDVFPKVVRWTTLKKKDWKHENEWRYLFFDINPKFEKDTRLKPFLNNAIKEIVLGFKFFPNIDYVKIDERTTQYTLDKTEDAYSLKILELLFNKDYPIKRVLIKEDFTLVNEEIIVKDIHDKKVMIVQV